MNVFISWSGEASKTFAIAVNNWLKQAMHRVKPWMSDAEIGPGERWNEKVSATLKVTNFGIICVTPENLTAPWILFEAGALAKAVDSARVVPLLLGAKKTDLVTPLSQFQAVMADKEGFLKLAAALNSELRKIGEQLDEPVLTSLLAKLWPELERELKRIRPSANQSTIQMPRSERDLLGDVLEGVRRLERSVGSRPAVGDSAEAGPTDWQDYYIRGANLASNLGDPVADMAALRAYSDAIVLAPGDLLPNLRARLYAHRGSILKRLRRLDEAENDLAAAMKWASEDAEVNDATYHMASVKAMKGDRPGALGLLEILLSRDPRWVSLVKARPEYFPDVLQDAAFRKLANPRARPQIGRPVKVGPLVASGDRDAPGRQSSQPHNATLGGSRVGLAHREPVTIVCFNKATVPLGVNLGALTAAMQVYVDGYVARVGDACEAGRNHGVPKGSLGDDFSRRLRSAGRHGIPRPDS